MTVEIIGYLSLTIMGITLGLVGAGGSILTIPILVYVLGYPIITATTYSLVIVGTSASTSVLFNRSKIYIKRALVFAIPSSLGVFISRHLIMPALPNSLGSFSVDQALTILLLIFMLFGGYFMVNNISFPKTKKNKTTLRRVVEGGSLGFGVGSVVGILGAGGGFLIIPALVLFTGLTMAQAVHTSLFIIATNSFVGFVSDKHPLYPSDLLTLSKFLLFSIIGMFIGAYLSKYIDGQNLKKCFGYFTWVTLFLILLKEFATPHL